MLVSIKMLHKFESYKEREIYTYIYCLSMCATMHEWKKAISFPILVEYAINIPNISNMHNIPVTNNFLYSFLDNKHTLTFI